MPENREELAQAMASHCPRLARVVRTEGTGGSAVLKLEMADGQPLGHRPGQFVQVSMFGYGEVPISICSSPSHSQSFELCVQPVGNVTRAMQRLAAGDWVGIRGPYGYGFPLAEAKNRHLLLVAGGIGLAPLRSLIVYALDRRAGFGRLILVYGARTPAHLLFKDDLERWQQDPNMETYLTVDEADEDWQGRVGVVTEPLREINLEPEFTIAAVVGPPIMYRFVAMELFKKGMPERQIYFSLERRFKCGIGKCGHCQLNDLYVCQNGPVFRYSTLLRRPEAVEVWAPERDQD